MKRSRLRVGWLTALFAVIAALVCAPVIGLAVDGEGEGEGDALAETTYVAQIGDKQYTSIDDAIGAADNGATIQLLADVTATTEFNKSLTFTGDYTLTLDAVGWVYTSGETLIFDGTDFQMTASSEAHQFSYNDRPTDRRWMMMVLAGNIVARNGANVSFTFDSTIADESGSKTTTGIYVNEGSQSTIKVENNSSFSISGSNTMGVDGQAIQLGSTANNSIKVTGGSSFLIDGTNRGYVNSPLVYVEDSTFTVRNCTANASNGGEFIAKNAQINFEDNNGHGLSADKATIQNSVFTADGNAYRGISINDGGSLTIDKDSEVTVSHNSWGADESGLKVRPGATAKIESGAIVCITDNYCSGLSNNGKVTFEEGSQLTITGNLNDKGTTSHGGGIYNSGDGANLTLPSDAVIYNNHAATDGDDIFNNTTATITFGRTGEDWALDGTGIGGVADDCTDAIDGWYDDSKGARWEAHTAPVHADEFTDFDETGTATVKGLTALKAAHGLIPVDPGDPSIPGWTTSKSKTATNLNENFESDVTLSLPSAEEEIATDIVFVVDKSSSSRNSSTSEGINMLNDLQKAIESTDATLNVGVIVFDGTSHVMRDLSPYDEQNVRDAMSAEIPSGESVGGTNMEAGLMAAQSMLDADGSVPANRKNVIVVSDGLTRLFSSDDGKTQIIYNELDADGTTYFGEFTTWCLSNGFNDGEYKVPGGGSWLDYYNNTIKPQVEADGDTYVVDYTGADNTSVEPSVYIPLNEVPNHAQAVDRAFYDAYNAYLSLDESYNCFAIFTGNSELGQGFMETLNGGAEIDFDSIYNDIYYLLSAGSEVVDVIGSGTYDDGMSYNFSFINDPSRLQLTVGGEELEVTEIAEASLPEHATSGYGFSKSGADGNDYELYYYAQGQDGKSDECFVWKINVPVSNFAPVQLTYSVKLDNPRTDDGLYGTYDKDGTAGYDGLLTNLSATLYPVDSNGEQGVPENFYKPTVSYAVGQATITPADITIYMGGDSGYDGVIDDGEAIAGSNSLPEPGFYITLPDYVNDALEAAGLASGDAPANLTGLLTIEAQTNDGASRTWTLEPYGATPELSASQTGYIYRVVPGEGQDPVRLQFTDAQGNIQTTDAFEPSSALFNTYGMDIYSGGVDMSTVTLNVRSAENGIDFSCALSTQPGVLTIRYVTAEQSEVVTGVLAEDELASARAANPDKAFAVLPEGTTYTINNSTVDVTLDGTYAAAPSLLFDDVVSDYSTAGAEAYDVQLADLTLQDLASAGVSLQNPHYQAKYLDLVDANNGNVWLSASNPIDVYWPYPEGTDENTQFYLVHFEGLHREMANEDVSDLIASATRVDMSVENTEHGIKFTTDGFSPFVLVWDAGASTEPSEPTGPTNPEQPVTPTTPQKPAVNVDRDVKTEGLPYSGDTTNTVLPAVVLGAGVALVGLVAWRSRRHRV